MAVAAANYVVDANVYISAYRRYYAFEFGTKFWDLLKQQAISGRVVSIDKVRDEILIQGDALADWVKHECSSAFVSTDRPDVLMYYGKIMNWARSNSLFKMDAKEQFAKVADGWIVAYALAGGHTVVTHEEYNRDAKRVIKIPNACEAFNVRYVDTFAMLRENGWKIA